MKIIIDSISDLLKLYESIIIITHKNLIWEQFTYLIFKYRDNE